MQKQRVASPWGTTFCDSISFGGPGRWIYISGQIGADENGEPDCLIVERTAVSNGVESPGLERQAVLGTAQHIAVGMRVGVDQPRRQDHAVAGDDVIRARASCPPLVLSAQDCDNPAILDSDRRPLDQQADFRCAETDVVDENHRLIAPGRSG